MAAAVIYEGVQNTSGDTGTLFGGQKFWFSHQVPARKWLIENAEANGAVIVPLDKQADVLFVDHARKNQAPGTHSYRYVEQSIRNGALEDLADHVVGAQNRASRVVGSVTTAPKGTRNFFTEADDQLLWDWVKPYEDMGGSTGGNVIYQQLESLNARHTYQSWRDRWLKYVKNQEREVKERNIRETILNEEVVGTQANTSGRRPGATAVAQRERGGEQSGTVRHQRHPEAVRKQETPPGTRAKERGHAVQSPEVDEDRSPLARRAQPLRTPTRTNATSKSSKLALSQPDGGSAAHWQASPTAGLQSSVMMAPGGDGKFTMEEAKMLMTAAGYILDAPNDMDLDASWEKVARAYENHTAHEWKEFFYAVVAPAHQRKLARRRRDWEPEELEEFLEEGPGLRTELQASENEMEALKLVLDASTAPTKKRHTTEKQSPHRQSYVDRGTSPIQPPEDIPAHKQPQRVRSSSVDPQSSTVARAPEPNEARKRSPDKSSKSSSKNNSQDSEVVGTVGSQSANGVSYLESSQAGVMHSPSKRKRDDYDDASRSSPALPSLDDIMGPRQKRIKRLPGQVSVVVETLEIPSTPPEEVRRSESPLFMPKGPEDQTPTSQDEEPGISYVLDNDDLEFVDEDTDDVDEDDFEMKKRKDGSTSPLSIKLVSEPEMPPTSSHLQSQPRTDEGGGVEDGTPDFETALGFSQAWQTAPDLSQEFETAQEEVTVIEAERHQRVETQALFGHVKGSTEWDEAEIDEDEFALPEPEGGWADEGEDDEAINGEGEEEQEILETYQEPRHNQDGNKETAADLTLPSAAAIDEYVDAQLAAHPDLDEEFLLMAVDATCLDPALIPTVYESIAGGAGIPEGTRGVWTEEDDQQLEGANPDSVKRVEEKHGSKWVEKRWLWRQVGGR